MALQKQFSNSINKFKQNFRNRISRFIKDAEDIPLLIVQAFVARARWRLLSYDPSLSNEISNIRYEKTKSGYRVVVSNDAEGIMTFLEYGTGILGKNNQNPNASTIGWDYAVNEADYKTMPSGDRGWLFKGTGENYIAPTDYKITKKVYIRKDGSRVSIPENRGRFFSQGIPAVRYIYDTRREINNAINLSRTKNGLNIKSLRTRLTNLLNKGIIK